MRSAEPRLFLIGTEDDTRDIWRGSVNDNASARSTCTAKQAAVEIRPTMPHISLPYAMLARESLITRRRDGSSIDFEGIGRAMSTPCSDFPTRAASQAFRLSPTGVMRVFSA